MAVMRALVSAIGGPVAGRGRVILVASAVALAAVGVPQALAWTRPGTVSRATRVTLPLDNVNYGTVGLAAVDCGSKSRCVGVGKYGQSAGTMPLVVPITNEVPGTARSFTLPSDAATSSQNAQLSGVDCPSATTCLATGFYKDNAGGQQGMVVPITNGVPGTAHKIGLPSDHATDSTQYVYPTRPSCPSTSRCLVGGPYVDTAGNDQGMVLPVTDGVPDITQKVPLPSGGQGGYVNAVSCPSATTCFAAGSSYNSSYTGLPMVVKVTNGVAGNPKLAALPSDARSTHPGGAFTVLHCSSANSCVAAGSYLNTSVDATLITAAIDGGVPGAVHELTFPSDAQSGGGRNSTIRSLSCPTSTSCTMVADYSFSDGHHTLVARIKGGTPTAVNRLRLPNDAIASGQNSVLYSVDCTSATSCIAVGSYVAPATPPATNAVGMSVAITNGIPAKANSMLPPADGLTSPQSAVLSSVRCPSAGSCVAGGFYKAGGPLEPLITIVRRGLAITGSLHRAGLRTRYRLTLQAAGGIGTHTWSIVAGHLPRGLSLNRTTGKLAGTPRVAGTFRVKFHVSDPGPPSQTANRTLTLRVLRPQIKLPRGVLRHHGRRVTVPLRCTRAARCAGNVKLRLKTAGTTVTIGRHRFEIRPGHTKRLKVRLNTAGVNATQGSPGSAPSVLEVVTLRYGHNRKHLKTLR